MPGPVVVLEKDGSQGRITGEFGQTILCERYGSLVKRGPGEQLKHIQILHRLLPLQFEEATDLIRGVQQSKLRIKK